MLGVKPAIPAVLDELGIEIEHLFGGGVYIKQTVIPAGVQLEQHRHAFDHLSYLVSGSATVRDGDRSTTAHGPQSLLIKAGRTHEVTALTDCVWLCIHATECTDPERIDSELIEAAA